MNYFYHPHAEKELEQVEDFDAVGQVAVELPAPAVRRVVRHVRHDVIVNLVLRFIADGGAEHFRLTIEAVRSACPQIVIEVLVPDFRGRLGIALEILAAMPPDVMTNVAPARPASGSMWKVYSTLVCG